ncbi:putative mitochondrial protein AtMg01250 [Silene latifolia]|uniref:putative mitochondrial protein AtMg01250 n=1 Tax=Silene latifolia TaxID=37657 RepID=UPI003D770ECF
MGFPTLFVHWLMTCVTTAHYSLKINGSIVGYFPGKKGLRQGDPLSPLLFVLSMEVLSRHLRQLEFKFHPKCAKVGLSHLLFADDLLIFSRGDPVSVQTAINGVAQFDTWSGLKANAQKSCIYFGGVTQQITEAILQATQFTQGTFPIRYLGTPLHSSRLTAAMYHSLIQKIQCRITHWASKNLSYAGRIQLINSTIFGLKSF